MKKLLVVLVLAALGVVIYTKFVRATPAEQSCTKLDDLCGGEKLEPAECRKGFDDAKKLFGEEAVDRAISCIDDAQSCMEAAGCIAGAGMKSLEQLERGFERGLGK